MIHSTSGIVLKLVKYGETSIVATILTRAFGKQSYLINGIRKKGRDSKMHLYQPASILDMEVYHNQFKNLQRVKEAAWKVVYRSVFTDVIKNSIALFMVELLQKSIVEEESNESLYDFAESQLYSLDKADAKEIANMPLLFMLSLASHLGFGIINDFSEQSPYFLITEGRFGGEASGSHEELSPVLNRSLSAAISFLEGGGNLYLNGEIRRSLLYLLERHYQFHIDGFTTLKSLRVIDMIVRD